jgi:hypothetical protein
MLQTAQKMKAAGRWILIVCAGLWILLAIISITTATHLIVLTIFPGAILWLAGWLLERFANTTS